MEDVLGHCLDRGVKVVVDVGGVNPAVLAGRVRDLPVTGPPQAGRERITGNDRIVFVSWRDVSGLLHTTVPITL